ncbi:MAG: bacterial Ig-like domain-containing protein, partial [Clostridia bacterium]|nr:bacterial Ig-like domain-containing protein [Clostridia bacterium]
YSFSFKDSDGEYCTKIGWYKANSDYTLSGFSSSTPGEKTITVKYGGKTTSFKVTVKPAHITNLSIYTQPSKTYYEVGESLDINGLRLKAIYSDGSTQIITNGYSVRGFDPYKCGTQDVEVEYDGLYTYFAVVVDAPGAPAEPGDPGEGGGYLPGDMDSDGNVDSDDAIYLLRHVLYPNDYVIDQNADIDGDGDVDSDDAIYLLRHVLYPNDYPIEA